MKDCETYIQREGFEFGFDPSACVDCPGHCCRGESGNIWVNQQEIFQMCNLLKINTIDFIQKYLNRISNRFSIKERFEAPEFQCVFFEDIECQCSIYGARPLQCRQYPFWEPFRRHKDQVVKECPGIRVKAWC